MGASDLPVPPGDIRDRNATVHTVKGNVVEVPFDPHAPEVSRWFDQSSDMRKLTHGNTVSTYTSGADAIRAMAFAITTACNVGHYIYMLNWYVDLDFPLGLNFSSAINSTTTLGQLLQRSNRMAQIRGMFWDVPFFQNSSAVNRLNDQNAFPGAAAILDNNTLNSFSKGAIVAALASGALLPIVGTAAATAYFAANLMPGTHHQKVLIVKGLLGLVAFVGGVDWNEDRIRPGHGPGSPLHDVHCRIEGPAAKEVLRVFLDRWQDHPESQKLKSKGVSDLIGLNEPDPPASGVSHIQIGCTFGNGTEPPHGISNVFGGNYYSFAPHGERSAERLIEHAISMATQFIYIEDQYLVGLGAAYALNKVLPNIQKLIILIPHSSISDHPHIWKMRKDFVQALTAGISQADRDKKIAICYRKEFGDPPMKSRKTLAGNILESYIHAKMMIVDDKFASVGSANCGFRSYSNDSEIVAGIFDESQEEPGRSHVAHDLRIQLWVKHLKLPPQEVFDPIGAAVHWFNPRAAGGVDLYDPDADTDPFIPHSLAALSSEKQAEPYGGIPGREYSP